VPDGFGIRNKAASRSPRLIAARRYVKAHRPRIGLVAAALVIAVAAAAGGMAAGGGTGRDVMVNAAATSAPNAAPAGAIKAASFDDQSGAQVETTLDEGGGQDVGWLANGDWMRYNGVDLGAAGNLTTSIRLAASRDDTNPRPGTVELRIDSVTGPLIGSIPVESTGGWQSWVTQTGAHASAGGKHDVFLVMVSAQGRDFVNINWFAFAAGAGSTPTSPTATGSSAPSATTSGPTASATSMPSMSMPPSGRPSLRPSRR
jgi:hypothetical protein